MSPTSTLLTQAIAKVKACYHDDHHTEQWDTESSSALYNFILYLPLKRRVPFLFFKLEISNPN